MISHFKKIKTLWLLVPPATSWRIFSLSRRHRRLVFFHCSISFGVFYFLWREEKMFRFFFLASRTNEKLPVVVFFVRNFCCSESNYYERKIKTIAKKKRKQRPKIHSILCSMRVSFSLTTLSLLLLSQECCLLSKKACDHHGATKQKKTKNKKIFGQKKRACTKTFFY